MFSNFVKVLPRSCLDHPPDHPIDFVVVDTVPGAKRADECVVAQSTISRFACRILISRIPPYKSRIFAAGFDSSKNIFLGVRPWG
jgi:pellino protein